MEDLRRVQWPGWKTIRLIGRGNFGAVYEIERDVLEEKEKAALKVIIIPQSESDISEMRGDGYDDESITNTFKKHLKSIVAEYSLMRKLNGSANVVNCDDVRYVQHDDGFGWDIFIKMELLTPLVEVLPSEVYEVSEDQVIKIAKDLSRALVLCRKFDIVHRDIKPQNIFVSPLGDYKLGDFGIAKTVEKTSGGTKIGTYKYMAPEVYNNQPYGAGADIYSLGLVLYWLLNERRIPFLPLPPIALTWDDENNAREKRFRGDPLPPPAHGSEELKRIVLKACAYDPKDRYATAAEMLRDLEGLKDKQEDELPFIPPEPVPKPRPDTGLTDDDDPTIGAFGDHTDTKDNNDPIDQEDPSSLTDGPFGHDPSDQPAKDDEILLQQQAAYTDACALEAHAQIAEDFYTAASAFEQSVLQGYLDSADRSRKCRDRAEQLSKKAPTPPEPKNHIKKNGVIGAVIGTIAVVILVLIILARSGGQSNPNQMQESVPGDDSISKVSASPKSDSVQTPAPTITPTVTLSPSPAQEPRIIGIAAGENHTVGLYSDGTVVATGETGWPNRCRVSDWHDIKSIFAGRESTIGLKSDGTVVFAGLNSAICDVSSWTDIISCAAGKNFLVGVRADGTVLYTGYDHRTGLHCGARVIILPYEQIDENNITDIRSSKDDIERWNSNIVAVSADDEGNVTGVTSDGRMVTAGDIKEEVQEITEWQDIIAVSHHFGFYVAGLKQNGTVVKFAYSDEVANWRNIVSISSGFGEQLVGLTADGTVVAVGYSAETIHQLETWHDIIAVAAGEGHIVGLQSDGTVIAVGSNTWGQCNVSDW